MAAQEVGRWTCEKCGNVVVAAGLRLASFLGIGAFMGPCPWEGTFPRGRCGAIRNSHRPPKRVDDGHTKGDEV